MMALIGKIIFLALKWVLPIVDKFMDADNRKKLYALEEDRRENEAIDAAERFIDLVYIGDERKKIEGLLPYIERWLNISNPKDVALKKRLAIEQKKLRRIKHYLQIETDRFKKFN